MYKAELFYALPKGSHAKNMSSLNDRAIKRGGGVKGQCSIIPTAIKLEGGGGGRP